MPLPVTMTRPSPIAIQRGHRIGAGRQSRVRRGGDTAGKHRNAPAAVARQSGVVLQRRGVACDRQVSSRGSSASASSLPSRILTLASRKSIRPRPASGSSVVALHPGVHAAGDLQGAQIGRAPQRARDRGRASDPAATALPACSSPPRAFDRTDALLFQSIASARRLRCAPSMPRSAMWLPDMLNSVEAGAASSAAKSAAIQPVGPQLLQLRRGRPAGSGGASRVTKRAGPVRRHAAPVLDRRRPVRDVIDAVDVHATAGVRHRGYYSVKQMGRPLLCPGLLVRHRQRVEVGRRRGRIVDPFAQRRRRR